MDYIALKKKFKINTKKVDTFLDYLIKVNQVMNLTAIKNKSEMIDKHIYDSLLISEVYDFSDQLVLDVGSGGGFPGIPLALLFPTAHFVLLDSTQKKVNYLNDVIKLLKLKNVEAKCARVEELYEKEKYDVIIARALSELNIYLELVAYLAKINGHIIALKGMKGPDEVKKAKVAIDKLSLVLEDEQITNLTNKDKRYNYIFKKTKRTDSRYPRPYAEIKKKPL